MWPRARRGAWLAAAVLSGACSTEPSGSGAGATSGEPATLADARTMCEAECARTARCATSYVFGPDAGAHCVEACLRPWTADAAKNVRAGVPRAIARCEETLPCGTSDDACIGNAVAAGLGQTVDAAAHAPDVQACLAKQSQCDATPAHFSDDLCGSLVMLVDSSRAAAARCFDGTCDAVLACMKPLGVPSR